MLKDRLADNCFSGPGLEFHYLLLFAYAGFCGTGLVVPSVRADDAETREVDLIQ